MLKTCVGTIDVGEADVHVVLSGVCCSYAMLVTGFVITGSWDQKLRLWDPRMPSYQNCIVEITLPGKVYSMSVAGDMLVVGASGRHIAIYDTRK